MTLYEAFILTCHTTFVADSSFMKDGGPSQLYLDMAAELLERDVFLEEFLVEPDKIIKELRERSYNKWMEIVNATKEN